MLNRREIGPPSFENKVDIVEHGKGGTSSTHDRSLQKAAEKFALTDFESFKYSNYVEGDSEDMASPGGVDRKDTKGSHLLSPLSNHMQELEPAKRVSSRMMIQQMSQRATHIQKKILKRKDSLIEQVQYTHHTLYSLYSIQGLAAGTIHIIRYTHHTLLFPHHRQSMQLNLVMDLLPMMVHAKDANGNILLSNKEMAGAYGCTRAQLEGQVCTLLTQPSSNLGCSLNPRLISAAHSTLVSTLVSSWLLTQPSSFASRISCR
jgi:hypothetical protein